MRTPLSLLPLCDACELISVCAEDPSARAPPVPSRRAPPPPVPPRDDLEAAADSTQPPSRPPARPPPALPVAADARPIAVPHPNPSIPLQASPRLMQAPLSVARGAPGQTASAAPAIPVRSSPRPRIHTTRVLAETQLNNTAHNLDTQHWHTTYSDKKHNTDTQHRHTAQTHYTGRNTTKQHTHDSVRQRNTILRARALRVS